MAYHDMPLNELLSSSMVELHVGASQQLWVLHEKLLCHHSPFFRKTVQSNDRRSIELPDEDEEAFKTVVGWLYSSLLPQPRIDEESDLTIILDAYLMAEKWGMTMLSQDALHAVREWYRTSNAYPSLRRLQYVYANAPGSTMSEVLLHAVARHLVLEKRMPRHWDRALRKHGDLAVDLLQAVQAWRLDDHVVPDSRVEPETDGPDEANDSGEADGETVVESPSEMRHPEHVLDAPKKDVGFRAPELLKDLNQLPNGLGGGDYGTVH